MDVAKELVSVRYLAQLSQLYDVRFNYFILFLLNDVSQSVCMFTRVKKCTLKGSKEAEKISKPLSGYYMITAGVVVAVVNDC